MAAVSKITPQISDFGSATTSSAQEAGARGSQSGDCSVPQFPQSLDDVPMMRDSVWECRACVSLMAQLPPQWTWSPFLSHCAHLDLCASGPTALDCSPHTSARLVSLGPELCAVCSGLFCHGNRTFAIARWTPPDRTCFLRGSSELCLCRSPPMIRQETQARELRNTDGKLNLEDMKFGPPLRDRNPNSTVARDRQNMQGLGTALGSDID